ncbi:TPA: hypothetical protein U1Z45_000249 [Streptococcus suis]|nr:hypothetical protein [Streptococcus suis]HEM5134044.1 hypothetical protein [Streptococcus suis]
MVDISNLSKMTMIGLL